MFLEIFGLLVRVPNIELNKCTSLTQRIKVNSFECPIFLPSCHQFVSCQYIFCVNLDLYYLGLLEKYNYVRWKKIRFEFMQKNYVTSVVVLDEILTVRNDCE